MSSNQGQFIENLARDLKPKRYWRPQWRALTWGLTALALNTLALLLVQSFRPGFFAQLVEHPRFLLEIASALFMACFFIYYVFLDLVPGQRLSNWMRWSLPVFLFVFLLSLYESFGTASPETSSIGARAHCLEELIIYGLMTLGTFCYFAFRSPFPLTRSGYFSMGLASAIFPGTLMQLACMYSPQHGLMVHYGPVFVMGLLSLALFPFIKSR